MTPDDAELVRRLHEHSPEEPWTGPDGMFVEAAARIEALEAALRPFAAEGEKWLTTIGHDDLTLCVAEDWHLASSKSREAAFTIGDLKRARKALAP